ncbi:hypothetical protein TTHERM_000264928 (macronuclear) [Tetrahymena thermophila SB210]|uniref:Uncharacterized protein n=1 Tax=Tetrahymena thermophila (strain SB210) TaxID=312017 RepID=W7XEI7_TETTS|nr:hypothetical protein TTHERM_000264928 [Tetrahymena thermophila SB210]EWS76127.1 hypothetical protein TTHERM_000264928 [Tetrahymena thermophila SB210]|eukprot:XP_012651367.1 hypothetical protein TTHERM_000264928 [Tetrahymena thermophila SB210]
MCNQSNSFSELLFSELNLLHFSSTPINLIQFYFSKQFIIIFYPKLSIKYFQNYQCLLKQKIKTYRETDRQTYSLSFKLINSFLLKIKKQILEISELYQKESIIKQFIIGKMNKKI